MLTFDTIRDFERKENAGKILEKLPDDLLDNLNTYLRTKERSQKTSDEILELENIRNTIKRFVDSRVRKILESAFDYSRAGLEPRNLAPWEKDLFDDMVRSMKKHRSNVAEKLKKPVAEEKEEAFLVKKPIPEFIGPDLSLYRLNKGDVVKLKKPLNDLLLKKGVVERA